MKQRKVAIIGTNGIPARYGGFETLAEYLARYLNQEYDLFCYCAKTPKEKQLKNYLNTELIYLPFRANGWQSMVYDSISIFHAFLKFDVLVILGFSGVLAFPLKPFFRKKKIVFNIGGIEWQKVRGKKALARIEIFTKKWFERICIRYSDTIIVDNQVLWHYVKDNYGIDAVLAEYGGNHAVFKPITEENIEKFPFLSAKYDVTISRAQEDMNIHVLLKAYEKMPERILAIISNWDTSTYGKTLKSAYKDRYSNIILIDAIYNLDELNVIRSNASIYFHTHSLCGTAPSLTEAMSLGLPVICFNVLTNRATTEEISYYFEDAESLLIILKTITQKQLIRLGENMKEIACRRYTWPRIVQLYKECINN